MVGLGGFITISGGRSMNPKSKSRITQALHERGETVRGRSVVTPLYQCSAFHSDSPYFYTRKNNPNIAELETVMRLLEGSEHALAVTTGMTAISLVLDLLVPDDVLVVNTDIYGCSYKLFQRLSERRQFSVQWLDLSQEAGLSSISKSARMIIFETPTNPYLKTIKIAHVRQQAPNALIVVDNTWATPLFQQPLNHGADISLHSATKYLSGHSDVMGGFILTNREELDADLRASRFYTGGILDPHSAWLLRRSIQTLEIRMNSHVETARRIRDFLASRPQVARVYFPEVDGQQLLDYGGILFFQFRAGLADRYEAFAKALTLFDTGTGMACVTSMVAQPYTGSHASMTTEEKAAIGLGRDLIRLSFGLEHADDLEADLAAAFAAVEHADKVTR
jgi:cystathionine beta-lyase/cystathionine gamma-synthase